jgi:phospholipid/cholesterol/gamma-HCH transport system substrate-binding protein
MSAYKKNILVGATVLVSLALLGWMILKFGAKPAVLFTKPQFPVVFKTDRADGIDQGSNVAYRGVKVGTVANIRRSDDQRSVIIDGLLDREPPLPANVEGVIRSNSALGSAATINLDLIGPDPKGQLQPHQEIPARYVGLDVFPHEFADLARDLRETSRQFRESNVVVHLDETIRTTQQQITKAGELIDSMNRTFTDSKLRQDLDGSAANIREATDTAKKVAANLEKFSNDLNQFGGSLQKLSSEATTTVTDARTTINKAQGHVDELAKQVSDRLEQLSKILEDFRSVSAKINQGQGTAGLLVNDPKLYQSLVDTSRELNATITDLKRLVEQWEQEGVTFRLNK